VAAIKAHFEPLRHFPLSGASRPQLAPGLRVTFHRPYAIYYKPLAEALLIVRVVHGARDTTAIVERGEFQ
jgi:toxin ParE1/3/4